MSGLLRLEESSVPNAFPLLQRPGIALVVPTLFFTAASALDLIMTCVLLTHEQVSFIESNPVARYFLYSWGLLGMLYFKCLIVGFVAMICWVIARTRLDLAKRVLYVATAIVSGVVVYSFGLMVVHTS